MEWIGVDAHKRLLVAEAVDERGQAAGTWRGANDPEQWAAVAQWADRRGGARLWGIEGSGHYGRGLAQWLVARGEVVVEINPRWTAQARRRSRRQAKSDHADALAIARLLVQEGESLARVQADDVSSELAVLTRERETLQAEMTRTRNQLHAALHDLDPTYRDRLPALTTAPGVAAVLAWDATGLNALERVRLGTIQRLAERLQQLQEHLAVVSREVSQRGRAVGHPLTALYGIAELSAGLLIGYLGPGDRFATDARLAQYAGVAPLEASSAGGVRHRLNRHGHRALNAIVHRMALTQARRYTPAKTYLRRKLAEGKTWREAVRALKRYLIRAIWNAWKQCLPGIARASLAT